MREIPPHVEKLLQSRYYLRSESGELLENSIEQMYQRVAHAVAQAEHLYPFDGMNTGKREFNAAHYEQQFYNLMVNNNFLPNSPALMNAGKDKAALSACFVLPIEDSMEGIFDTLKMAGMIFKNAGGVGYSFSDLREKGSLISTTGQKSSGPIEFMKMYNQMTEAVKAGGGRRGASMGAMSVSHPDVEEFIKVKDDGVTLTNFNLSLLISNEFMQAVKEDKTWSLYSPNMGKEVSWLSAKTLWKSIVHHAWNTGEPGLVFIDTVNDDHPFESDKYEIKNVNACAELGLLPYESCNLGSINLSTYIVDDAINYKALEDDIPIMIRFLDNVIDVNYYLFPEIEEATKNTRKLGLGIMGWADMLIKLKIPYNSQEALDLAEDLMSFISDIAGTASKILGEERGSFPAWKDSDFYPNIPRRNACLFAIAPTGTLSRISGCSSAIEPNFAWNIHHSLGELEYDEIHWAWKDFVKHEQEMVSAVLPNYIKLTYKTPDYMVTAMEITPEWHLKHQEVFQKYIDQSISKSINLPNTATEKDVEDIFMWAWEHQLKGITVYRDGSRNNQPLQEISSAPNSDSVEDMTKRANQYEFIDGEWKIPTNEVGKETNKENTKKMDMYESLASGKTVTVVNNLAPIEQDKPYRKRGKIAMGITHKIQTNTGKLYVTCNYDRAQKEVVEIFIRLGPSSTPREIELCDWASRMLSLCLKHNVPITAITRQSEKIFGDGSFIYQGKFFNSLPQLIAHLIKPTWQEVLEMAELEDTYYDPEEGWEEKEIIQPVEKDTKIWDTEDRTNKEFCYSCSTWSVVKLSGCKTCLNCGDSICG